MIEKDSDILDEQLKPVSAITHRDLWEWWKDRTFKFNVILFGTALIFFFILFIHSAWVLLFVNPLSLLWIILSSFIYILFANVFYILGWWLESLLLLFTKHSIEHPLRKVFWYLIALIAIAPFIYLSLI